MTNNDDRLRKLLHQFEESQEQTRKARELSERDRDYYDGRQWTNEEIAALQARKQPVVVSNRIKPKIDSLIGFEKRQRTDPKAYPRTPKHDQDAEAATDALRFVAETNSFSKIRSDVAENVFIEGAGAVVVGMVERPSGDLDVEYSWVPWDRFYYDPHSRRRDFSDAGYKGVIVWMDEVEVEEKFPGSGDVVRGCYTGSDDDGDSSADRPKVVWSDSKRKRVRVIQHRWLEKGRWMTATLCRGGFLRDPQESPYLDEYGRPECDVIAVSAYVSRDNDRYGVVRQHISPQDEINKRRSKLLHRLSVRQVIAEHGAVQDVALAKRELARPDGWIEKAPDLHFEIVDQSQAIMGEANLLAEAKAEIDTSGVNPSLEGNKEAPSGRAQEIQQASGLAEMAVVFDALRDWSWRVYRASWNRVRQYWTDEKWIRVTDDDRNVRFVGLNHPVTVAEEAQRMADEGEPVPPELQAAAAQMPSHVLRIENPVAETDVDIRIEDGPDTVTIQAEQFEQLVQLKQSDPAAIPTQMVIEASSLRNKDRIMEHLQSGGIPPQVQQQMQQMQEQLQQAQQALAQAEQQAQSQQADQQKHSADMAIKQYELRIKERELAIKEQELGIDQYRAETERIQAAMPPMIETRPPETGAFS